MSLSYYVPSLFETFNARHLSPDEVARTFVPPIEIFSELVTRNHHVLIGPRGSGKTTLLKMLTLPALACWDVGQFETVIPKTDFIGIFVAADRGWRAQLSDGDTAKPEEALTIGHAAFTTHVLLSFIQTLRDMQRLDRQSQGALVRPLVRMEPSTEANLVDEISEVWQLRPSMRSLGGLSIALRARLASLGSLKRYAERAWDPEDFLLSKAPYATLGFRDCISHAIEAREVLTNDAGHAWAFLFDEFEVAPSVLQREILNSFRGEADTRILYKVALAPYNKHFMSNVSDISAAHRHDFRVIDLWYPEKGSSYGFSDTLLKRLLHQEGIEVDRLRQVFDDSDFGFPEINDTAPYENEGKVADAFNSLAKIDDSFQQYLKRKNIDLTKWKQMNEIERAEVRKIRSIVITREYFLRTDGKAHSTYRRRSRKIRTLYTGYPTILALCEGNPRLLIGTTAPIIRKLVYLRQAHSGRKIDRSFQAAQIKFSANSFRSLLKTIPYSPEGGIEQRGLLRLLDKVGDYFHRKCVLEEFSPQPPLTFTIDANIDDETLQAVGRALNAGAIIYVPDQGADPILTSLRGKRFRLCYLLAAYYKLPIMLGTSISLSTIIGDRNGSSWSLDVWGDAQDDLFRPISDLFRQIEDNADE